MLRYLNEAFWARPQLAGLGDLVSHLLDDAYDPATMTADVPTSTTSSASKELEN